MAFAHNFLCKKASTTTTPECCWWWTTTTAGGDGGVVVVHPANVVCHVKQMILWAFSRLKVHKSHSFSKNTRHFSSQSVCLPARLFDWRASGRTNTDAMKHTHLHRMLIQTWNTISNVKKPPYLDFELKSTELKTERLGSAQLCDNNCKKNERYQNQKSTSFTSSGASKRRNRLTMKCIRSQQQMLPSTRLEAQPARPLASRKQT